MKTEHKISLNHSMVGSDMDNKMRDEVMRSVMAQAGTLEMESNDSTSDSDSSENGGWRTGRRGGVAQVEPIPAPFMNSCLQRIKLVIPHVTLVLATISYMLLGALVFYYIERPNEEMVKTAHRDGVRQLRKQLLEEAWNLGASSDTMDEDAFIDKIGTQLDDIINETLRSFAEGVTANALNDDDGLTMQWTYPSAVFFSATVITTIGYGHLVPVTLWGRLVCIVYALLGIPLALVTTADIGKFVSMALTNCFERYQKFKEERLCPKKGVKHMLSQMHGGIIPRREKKADKSDKDKLDLEKNGEVKKAKTKVLEEEEDDDDEYDEAPVPPSLLLCLLLGYTAASAWLFTQWEGWNFLTSFYFCFITMITVGFGDLFPTTQEYLFPAIVFIFTGLILTTMCIDLVGTHYIRKIHYFGRQIQSAKEAFAALGIPDWLKQKGINESNLRNMMLNPEDYAKLMAIGRRNAFMPDDLDFIKFIDQKLSSTDEDTSLLSSVTLSSRVFKSSSKDVQDIAC